MSKKKKQYFADGCVLCPSAQVARVYQADYLKGSYYWGYVLTACVCAAVAHCVELKKEEGQDHLMTRKVRFTCPDYYRSETVVFLPQSHPTVPNVGKILLSKADFHFLRFCCRAYETHCFDAQSLAMITGDTIELPDLAIRYVSARDATPRKSGHQRVYNPNDMKFSIWENKNKSKENESNARNKTIRKKEEKES